MGSGLLRENFSARNAAVHCLAPPRGGSLEACRARRLHATLRAIQHVMPSAVLAALH